MRETTCWLSTREGGAGARRPSSPPSRLCCVGDRELPTETGAVRVVKYVAAVDCGTAINPKLAEGQTEGGVLNGISYALTQPIDMRVQERYTRLDHNTLEMTVTINDPKAYTKPFEITKTQFKWLPKQEIREEICVPSVMTEYEKSVAEPASDPSQ